MVWAEVGEGPLPLVFNGEPVPTWLGSDFMQADHRRATGFITNFGNWQLPPAVAEQFRSPVAHVEWFHETGELVAFNQVPRLGEGEIEISDGQAAVDLVAGTVGGVSGRIERTPDGATRQFFPAMVVDAEALVAVLAVIEHGPRVHRVLWGWHFKHRDNDGWGWLEEQLKDHDPERPDDEWI